MKLSVCTVTTSEDVTLPELTVSVKRLPAYSQSAEGKITKLWFLRSFLNGELRESDFKHFMSEFEGQLWAPFLDSHCAEGWCFTDVTDSFRGIVESGNAGVLRLQFGDSMVSEY